MSDYEEIVETVGDYRAKIVIDRDAEKPDYFGSVPVLQIDTGYYGGMTAEAFNDQARGFEDAFNRLSDLVNGNGYTYEVFERYLRIFHGTTVIDSYNIGVTREYGYIGFDTAQWRDEVGADPERLKEERILSEVEAWASGDVWGVVIEKRVKWSTDDEDYEDTETWEEVEDGACWGYYGQSYAEETAREELKGWTKE